MIHIEQYQKVSGKDDLQVVTPTGDYNEEDLLECALSSNLSNPICMLQAQYVAFGSMVYQQDEVLSNEQVSALLSGEPAEDVIGNEDLIEGKGIVTQTVEPKTVTATSPAPENIPEKAPTPEPIPEVAPEVIPEPVPEPASEPIVTPETTIDPGVTITPENISDIIPENIEVTPAESPVTLITKKSRIARTASKRKVA